jgi:flagellar basal body-associated protein FliL
MSDKADKKPDDKAAAAAAPAPAAEGKKAKGGIGGLLKGTPALLGIVMILEAAVLFAGFKFLGSGPSHAKGAELTTPEEGGEHGEEGKGAPKLDPKKFAEVALLEFKAPNKKNGRSFLYDVAMSIVTRNEHKEKVEAAIKAREATIKDRVRTIIAQCDPEQLGGNEPGLETLRRQVKFQLEELIGDGLVEEVIVPRCIPYRQEF